MRPCTPNPRRRLGVRGRDARDRRAMRQLASACGERGRAARAEFSWRALCTTLTVEAYSLAARTSMKIAILGTRGIPASYSGFETAAEQLASRLTGARPRGRRLLPPARRRPHAEGATRAPSSCTCARSRTSTSTRSCTRSCRPSTPPARPSPTWRCSSSPATRPLCLITRWARIPAVINVDGLDSDRRKWPAFAKAYLRFAERTAPRWADRAITDSHAVADIFERRYGERIGVVPYGVEDPGHDGAETLERLGLEPRKYILFVGRLEPENNPHLLVEAFSRISSRAGARDEAGDRRRRAVRRRVHPPGLAHGRPARGLPRLRLRRAATGSSSATPTCSARRPRSAAPTR